MWSIFLSCALTEDGKGLLTLLWEHGEKCPKKLIRTAAQDQNERKRAKMFVSNTEMNDGRWTQNVNVLFILLLNNKGIYFQVRKHLKWGQAFSVDPHGTSSLFELKTLCMCDISRFYNYYNDAALGDVTRERSPAPVPPGLQCGGWGGTRTVNQDSRLGNTSRSHQALKLLPLQGILNVLNIHQLVTLLKTHLILNWCDFRFRQLVMRLP